MMSDNRMNLLKWEWSHGKLWVVGILCIGACLLFSGAAFAEWGNDPDTNMAVTAISGKQCRPGIVYDGEGGYFVTWRDEATPGIFAQHYDSSGDTLWGETGAQVCSVAYTGVEATPDGEGGLIVSYGDWSEYYVYAQHLDSDGVAMWGEDGMAVFNDDAEGWIAPDGDGGAIVMGYYGYVTRVTSDGSLPWGDADNALEYDDSGSEWAPKIVSDGEGGAIMVWINSEDGDYIAVQRVSGDGEFLWGSDGDPLFISVFGDANCPRIASTGDGGAVVVWYEQGEGYAVYAQMIEADGDVAWGEGGVEVAIMGSIMGDSLDLAYDGSGGAFLTWVNEDDYTLYAQHVVSGELDWDDPVAMSAEGDVSDIAQHPRKTVEDGLGGFITAWYNDDDQVKAQRCDADGNVLWGAGGTVLSNGVSIAYGPKLASNGQGGAVAVWVDNRDAAIESLSAVTPEADGATGQDVFIQGINADGELGDPEYSSSEETVYTRGRDNNGPFCFVSTAEATVPHSAAGILLVIAALWTGVTSFSRRHSH